MENSTECSPKSGDKCEYMLDRSLGNYYAQQKGYVDYPLTCEPFCCKMYACGIHGNTDFKKYTFCVYKYWIYM